MKIQFIVNYKDSEIIVPFYKSVQFFNTESLDVQFYFAKIQWYFLSYFIGNVFYQTFVKGSAVRITEIIADIVGQNTQMERKKHRSSFQLIQFFPEIITGMLIFMAAPNVRVNQIRKYIPKKKQFFINIAAKIF